jgi:NAD(P)-dependent dehydrogenase (short-subunit alcohol dehydrogenase family)
MATCTLRRTYAVAVDDLREKTFLVTGANTGIGQETVRGLVARGAAVFLAGRSEAKTKPVIEELAADHPHAALRFIPLDLGDLASVAACAEAFLATGEPLHGLINNAGVAGSRGLTPSGFELMFGTNFVGPFLLTRMLLDRLRESAPARIVNVASEAHRGTRGIDFDAVRRPTRSLTGMSEYGVSKLANILHAQVLARRLDGSGVTTYALHPGVIASDIWRRVPWPVRPLMKARMRPPEQGAQTSLYCATSPEVAGDSGLYYDDCRVRAPGGAATSELGEELWRRTEQWLAA